MWILAIISAVVRLLSKIEAVYTAAREARGPGGFVSLKSYGAMRIALWVDIAACGVMVVAAWFAFGHMSQSSLQSQLPFGVAVATSFVSFGSAAWTFLLMKQVRTKTALLRLMRKCIQLDNGGVEPKNAQYMYWGSDLQAHNLFRSHEMVLAWGRLLRLLREAGTQVVYLPGRCPDRLQTAVGAVRDLFCRRYEAHMALLADQGFEREVWDRAEELRGYPDWFPGADPPPEEKPGAPLAPMAPFRAESLEGLWWPNMDGDQ